MPPSFTASDLIVQIEAAIRRDPARRGLLGAAGRPVGLGELAAASASLAESCRHAVLVTGFYIPLAEPAAAETDGPPGSVALACVLRDLGRAVTLVTDPLCGPALVAAATAAGLPTDTVRPLAAQEDLLRVLTQSDPTATHLIAIERVGPGYRPEIVRSRFGDETTERFLTTVPADLWGRCLNMRGLPIDDWTVDFSTAFEFPPAGVTTIGLGDGGNELGLGKFSWRDLVARLDGIADPRILCRVAADYAVIAGTSNWAAYGLAAATAVAAGRPQAFDAITAEAQVQVLEAMVRDGPAVDGVTRRFEPTVDGLPLLTYLEPLRTIRRRLGLRD